MTDYQDSKKKKKPKDDNEEESAHIFLENPSQCDAFHINDALVLDLCSSVFEAAAVARAGCANVRRIMGGPRRDPRESEWYLPSVTIIAREKNVALSRAF